MKLSSDQLNELARNNPAIARRNPDLFGSRDIGHSGAAPKLEPNPRDAALVPAQVQKRVGQSVPVRIRVTSFRRRLLDEDNLCEKYHVDLCRYSQIIPSDDPATTKIEVRQVKVGTKEKEFVRVEVF